MTMKHIKATSIAIAAALGLIVVQGARAAEKGCSNASLNGTFGYTATGVLTAPPSLAGPFATVGAQTFDGDGNTTATAWTSQNGSIVQVTIKGTYSVNPDCTGTMTLQVNVLNPPMAIPPTPYFFVLENGETEFQALSLGPGQVVTVIAKLQFPKPSDWRR
jgi:hypothetical protein